MARERLIIGYRLDCSGPLINGELALKKPVSVSFNVDDKDNRWIGCPYLKRGLCQAVGSPENAVCHHLSPESNKHRVIHVPFREHLLRFDVTHDWQLLQNITALDKEILTGLASGLQYQEITNNINLPFNYLRQRLPILYKKFKLSNKEANKNTAAVLIATQLGMVDLDVAALNFDESLFAMLLPSEIRILEAYLSEPEASTANIAEKLFITKASVRNVLSNIRNALNTNNTPQSVLFYMIAKKLGIIQLPENKKKLAFK